MMRRRAALLLQAGVLQALVMPRQPPIKTALRAAPDMEDLTRRVFCSRELNMANIEAVGFDMDYTLAQYNEAFDMLAFEGAKDKLIDMGYPEEAIYGVPRYSSRHRRDSCPSHNEVGGLFFEFEAIRRPRCSAQAIRTFKFDPLQHTRGLVIDKRRGNILKMDRHKYVRRAYHGTRELSRAERKAQYILDAGATPTFVGNDYVNVDSLFQLVDASLFAQLVDVLDEGGPSYAQAFRDVRHAVDLCHQDGVIKDQVAIDPSKYIIPDDNLVPMLTQYRLAGKKVFLLTNSLFDYTNVVMNFLVGKDVNDRDWVDLFDVVVVGAGKPAFLGDGRRDMLRVDAGTNMGTLHNFVGKPVSEVGGPAFLQREGKIFQSGTWKELHEMLEVDSGSEVLYVGDHMYGDMIRSKRSLGWRTTLIVPELEPELVLDAQLDLPLRHVVAEKEKECEQAELAVQELRLSLLSQGLDFLESDEREALEKAQEESREALKEARDALHRAYHPHWGPLFRSGNQASRFAKQVVDYSCIYTSRASNLLATSPSRTFRPPSDFMPHDDDERPPM